MYIQFTLYYCTYDVHEYCTEISTNSNKICVIIIPFLVVYSVGKYVRIRVCFKTKTESVVNFNFHITGSIFLFFYLRPPMAYLFHILYNIHVPVDADLMNILFNIREMRLSKMNTHRIAEFFIEVSIHSFHKTA